MIPIPSISALSHARFHRDSTDAQCVYVDLIQASPAKGDSAIRWMPIPNSLAYLVGEVSEGSGDTR